MCWRASSAPEQRPAGDTVFVRNLMQAADLAAEKNITLLIEPINARDRPGYFLNRVEHAADVIAKAERKNIRIQFDFYHVQIVGGDLTRRFEAHFPVIGHVQVGAVPSRHEPDEGEVNLTEMLALLDRSGYAGFVGAEYRPRGRTEDGLGWAGHTAWPRNSDQKQGIAPAAAMPGARVEWSRGGRMRPMRPSRALLTYPHVGT